MAAHSIHDIHLYRDDFVSAIAEEASGETALRHFARAIVHQGFAPSQGYDAIVASAVAKLRDWGYERVETLSFPSDGDSYWWACRTEPAWDVDEAELTMLQPHQRTLARFSDKPMSLGRFSQPTDVQAPLIHVHRGVAAEDYAGLNVKDKIVLAWGTPPSIFQHAVWERGALGLIWYRMSGKDSTPDATGLVYTIPWKSLDGKPLTFCFSLSYAAAQDLIALIESGQEVRLRAMVRSQIRPSRLNIATGVLPGSQYPDEEVWFLGHCDHRNAGGINNLSGFSSTLEIARVLSKLVRNGTLPRPKRTIRFFWGPEHHGTIAYLHRYPERVARVFAVINQDMVGLYRDKTGTRLTMRRTPHSAPHFINDIAEFFLDGIIERNQIDMSNTNILSASGGTGFSDPILAPTGSKHSINAHAGRFWGPSDQEDLMDGTIRVPTIALADWPDPFFHTDLDSIELADPTQMRRVITLAGSMGYYLSQLDASDVPFVIANALSRARCRCARQLLRAIQTIDEATDDTLPDAYREALNFVEQSSRRECAALRTLTCIAHTRQQIELLDKGIEALDAEKLQTLSELHAAALRKGHP